MFKVGILLFVVYVGARNDEAVPPISATVRSDDSECPPGWDCASRRRSCGAVNIPPPPPKRRIPFHMHVRKSGGSLLCHLALHAHKSQFQNYKRVEASGCNMAGDGPGNVRSGIVAFANRGWCCQDRYMYARKHQPGLIAREIFAPMGPLCTDYFLYSVIMRDPIRRIMSQMSFTGHVWEDVKFWLTHPAFNIPKGVIRHPIQRARRKLLSQATLSKSEAIIDDDQIRVNRSIIGITTMPLHQASSKDDIHQQTRPSWALASHRPALWPFIHGTPNYDNFYVRVSDYISK